eukprot:jgi/Pico_ML_1/55768/g1411.t1
MQRRAKKKLQNQKRPSVAQSQRSSMTAFKFKVKLTPGSQKKGKAAKLARDVLMRGLEATPREKELMRAVTDPELVQGMIGNVQLSMPGLQKIKQSAKQSKKSKKPGK